MSAPAARAYLRRKARERRARTRLIVITLAPLAALALLVTRF